MILRFIVYVTTACLQHVFDSAIFGQICTTFAFYILLGACALRRKPIKVLAII